MVAPGHYNVAADGSKDVERESCRKFFPLLSSYYVQRPLVCCWRRRGEDILRGMSVVGYEQLDRWTEDRGR